MHILRMNNVSLKKKILKFKNKERRSLMNSNFEKNYNFRDKSHKERRCFSIFDFQFMIKKTNFANRRNNFFESKYKDDFFSIKYDQFNNISKFNSYDFFFRNDFLDFTHKHNSFETKFDDVFFQNYRQMFHEKFENIENYYNDHVEWKRWKNFLKSKFWINFRQFFTNDYKIIYIRNHFKNVIYNIVNYRVKLHNLNFYRIFQEMLNDLEKNFEIKNELTKKTNEFYNVKFVMSKEKYFETFLTRFQNFVISLKLSNLTKIDQMSMKFNERMRFKLRFSNIEIWKKFVKKCRIV